MNSAADMGGMFIVPDVTACASLHCKFRRYRTLGDRLNIDHLSSEVGLGPKPVCSLSHMVMHASTV